MTKAYTITGGDLSAVIDPLGAELRSVTFRGHEYLWQADPAYWDGQSPLLFPYVGRFTGGKYTLHQKEYSLPIHGFAKDTVFDVEDQTDRRITFVLRDSEQTLAVYPCRFLLRVTYEIEENTLSASYEVSNPGTDTLYFGIGGHPAFQVPLDDGLDFEDYVLRFSQPHTPSRVNQTPQCFVRGDDQPYRLEHGTDLPLRHDLFDADAIILKDVADTVTLMSDLGRRSVTMRYTGLHYLGIWHMPRTDAPYVCIEPWSSLPSRQDIVEEFTCKSDLIRLPAGGTYRTEWKASLT